MSWSIHFLARSKAAAHRAIDEAPEYVPAAARAGLKALVDAQPDTEAQAALEIVTNGHIGTPDDPVGPWRQDQFTVQVTRRTIVG
jgi:hypothetical protein